MVARQLLHLAFTNPVDAAVPDVADQDAIFDDQDPDNGGPHAVHLRVLLGGLIDAQIRKLDACDQPVLFVAARLVHLVRPRSLGVGAGGPEELSQGVDRHSARHLAGGMPTHPVGNDVQVVLVGEHETVLVVSPLHPDVGVADGENSSPVTYPENPLSFELNDRGPGKSTKPAYTRPVAARTRR